MLQRDFRRRSSLFGELKRLERNQLTVTPQVWLSSIRWIDVMEPYAAYAGDWSETYASYRYQPLNGGHRAIGDCRARLELLQRMAAG